MYINNNNNFLSKLESLGSVIAWRFFPVKFREFNGEVAQDSDAQHGYDHPQFWINAHLGLQDVSKNEAQGFPEPVVGKGGFFITLKENSV